MRGSRQEFSLFLVFSLTVAVFCAAGPDLRAQTIQGTVLGTVTDQSGGVIPGAEVIITNLGTGFKRSAISSNVGSYEIPHLEPATYSVAVELPGFKGYLRQPVIMEANNKVRIDITLQVGMPSDQMVVEAQTPVVVSESGQIGATVDDRTMKDMAMGARNYSAWLYLTPGAGYGMRGYSYNGSRPDANTFAIDGIDMRSHDTGAEQTRYAPDFELLQEVRVDSVNNTAEFAHPGALTQVLKSGSNSFHGQGTWQHENGALNARSFFATTRPAGTPVNTGFFTAGGPVLLPRLYDGRNRTFFLVHYQRLQSSVTQALGPYNVPTPAMREGNLSALGVVVKDPLTGEPFADGIIPASRIQPAAVWWMKNLFPLPTRPSTTPVSNYLGSTPNEQQTSMKSVRVDQTVSRKNTFYTQYWWRDNTSISGDTDFPRSFFGDRVRPEHGGFVIVGDTHTFSPSVINEFRFGYNRQGIPYASLAKGKQFIDAMGLTGYSSLNPDAPGTPGITITGLQRTITETSGNYRWNNFNWVDHVSFLKGSHHLKTGADVQHHQYSNYPGIPSYQFGNFTFDGFATGQPFADFLLGLPHLANRQADKGPYYGLMWTWSLYFQDDWKLTRNFTLNWGLRYEVNPPWREKYGRVASFDVATGKLAIPDEGIAAVNPQVLQTSPYESTSQAGYPDSLVRTDRNNFAPRLGFAWRSPFWNMIVRGGYGLYYNNEAMRMMGDLAAGIFVGTQTFTNTITSGVPLWQWPAAFPTAANQLALLDVNAYSPNLVSSYVHQMNLTLEKQIGDYGVRISYIGSSGIQQPVRRNINQPLASTIAFTQSRRPFPSFNNIFYLDYGGHSSYNSFQAALERRFSKGFQVNANYTWAKNLSNVEDHRTVGSYYLIENTYDRARDYGNVAYGNRHRFVTYFLWQVPAGHERALLSNVHPLVNGLLGGWDISASVEAFSGPWWTPTFNGRDISNTNTTSGRPDRIADGNVPGGGTVAQWFDLSAFVRPASGIGRFGNAGKGIILGPGYWGSTMAIMKYFKLPGPESLKLRLQGDIINLFNHPMLGGNITSFPGIINTVDGAKIAGVNQDNLGFITPYRTIRVGLRLEW